MNLHALTISDVVAHAGVGTVFACTGACTRRFCKHTFHKVLLGATLIAIEATAVVAVTG